MNILSWLTTNFIEIFGAVTGIIYVFLEIRQKIWLWPVGVVTSTVYIWVFFTGKLYADMSLQVYYLVISFIGWYWWIRGTGQGAKGEGQGAQGAGHRAQGTEHGAQGEGKREKGRGGDYRKEVLQVTRLRIKTGLKLAVVFVVLFFVMWFILSRLTDSPVPEADSFITSLSVVATYMLARKVYEHWYLWIVINSAATILFIVRGLYPTMVLYIVYCIMSFVGLSEWKKSILVADDHPAVNESENKIPKGV